MLTTLEAGAGDPLVLVHGFSQSAAAWWPLVGPLESSFRLVAVDAPGHGGSAAVTADLLSGADLMAAAAPERAAWLGYSMGGRYALHVALRHPQAVTRLVLVSTTAGIDDPVERAQRRESDAVLADRVESEGVASFLAWWVGQPLFSTLRPEAARLEERVEAASAEGLASSLRLAGTGSQEPLWEAAGSLSMPVLVVAGELDRKYVGLGRRLVESIGSNAELRVIAGAGHACHLEKPADFLATVTDFLRR